MKLYLILSYFLMTTLFGGSHQRNIDIVNNEQPIQNITANSVDNINTSGALVRHRRGAPAAFGFSVFALILAAIIQRENEKRKCQSLSNLWSSRKKRASHHDFFDRDFDQQFEEIKVLGKRVDDPNWGSVQQYVYHLGSNCYTVPLAVRAYITRNSYRPRGASRADFLGDYYNQRMSYMRAIAGDEKGHLVASSLGGPAFWLNMAPQKQNLNRYPRGGGSGLDWRGMEDKAWAWVDNRCGDVLWRVTINYDMSNSCRPVGYRLNIIFYKNDGKQYGPFDHYYRN